jgi:hypothetical protein
MNWRAICRSVSCDENALATASSRVKAYQSRQRAWSLVSDEPLRAIPIS